MFGWDLNAEKASVETWMLKKPGKSFMQPMKVCLPRLNSCRCHTQLYARLWRFLSNFTRLVLRVDFDFVVSEVSCMVVFRDEGTSEPTTEMLCRENRTNPLTWEVIWVYLLDNVFWDCVTKHIYIGPFGILLIKRHTGIEHVMRPALFWDCTQRNVVIPFRCSGITNQSHLQGSSCPTRTCLDSRQPARTGCVLEQLTVTELVWW